MLKVGDDRGWEWVGAAVPAMSTLPAPGYPPSLDRQLCMNSSSSVAATTFTKRVTDM